VRTFLISLLLLFLLICSSPKISLAEETIEQKASRYYELPSEYKAKYPLSVQQRALKVEKYERDNESREKEYHKAMEKYRKQGEMELKRNNPEEWKRLQQREKERKRQSEITKKERKMDKEYRIYEKKRQEEYKNVIEEKEKTLKENKEREPAPDAGGWIEWVDEEGNLQRRMVE